MVRFIAFDAFLFLLPFAIYAAWLLVTKGSATRAADWTGKTIGYLAIGGALLLTVVLVAFTQFTGGRQGGTYTPAHVEDGRVVPGTIE